MAIEGNFSEGIKALVTSLTSAEKVDIANAIFKKTFEVSDITNSHVVRTNVRNGNQIPIIDNEPDYNSHPSNPVTGCDKPTCDITVNYSTEKWDLGLIECRSGICLRNFDEDFLVFWNEYRNLYPEVENLDVNSGIFAYIVNKVKNNLLAAKWRTTYFGDKSSNSSLLNAFDGFLIKLQAKNGIKISIAKNDVTESYRAQRMTGEEIYNTLKSAYNEATDTAWFEPSQFEIKMPYFTASVFAQWLNDSDKSKTGCCEIVPDPTKIQQASRYNAFNISFEGMPIVTHRELDEVIKNVTIFNGGSNTAAKKNPNIILFTRKNNLLIGTNIAKNLSEFDIFYDKKDGKVYIDSAAYLGTGVPTDEYVLAI